MSSGQLRLSFGKEAAMTVAEMMRLAWSWTGPAEVTEAGSSHFEIRIGELPDFFVAGVTREEALASAGPALRAFLQSYVDHGEEPPLPSEGSMAWVVRPARMPTQQAIPRVRRPDEQILRS
jgi:predicted RNase H-like HicB family nuclease